MRKKNNKKGNGAKHNMIKKGYEKHINIINAESEPSHKCDGNILETDQGPRTTPPKIVESRVLTVSSFILFPKSSFL